MMPLKLDFLKNVCHVKMIIATINHEVLNYVLTDGFKVKQVTVTRSTTTIHVFEGFMKTEKRSYISLFDKFVKFTET